MAREYKRKRLAEEWALDKRPNKIRKSINSTERQRAKKEISNHTHYDIGEEALDRWHEETKKYYERSPCVNCLMDYAVLDKLRDTMYKFKFILITDFQRDLYSCEHNRDTATGQA